MSSFLKINNISRNLFGLDSEEELNKDISSVYLQRIGVLEQPISNEIYDDSFLKRSTEVNQPIATRNNLKIKQRVQYLERSLNKLKKENSVLNFDDSFLKRSTGVILRNTIRNNLKIKQRRLEKLERSLNRLKKENSI
jgi:hypothetical protein